MARQEIPLGTAPTGEGGDNARQAFERVNQMTAELYAADQAQQQQLAALQQADADLVQDVAALDARVSGVNSAIEGLGVTLQGKVDKRPGYDLSQEDFTPAEKAKLAAIEGDRFKGTFTSLAALSDAHPTANPGDFADVDAGTGSPVRRAIWDASDSEWTLQEGQGGLPTAAQVKDLYESNPDTNPLTDGLKAKLDGIAAGAQQNWVGVTQAEAEAGDGQLWRSWTVQRVWQAVAAWWNSSAMKAKLDGIAAGATVNQPDAYLLNRANHTGNMPAANVTGLEDAVRATTLAGFVANSYSRVTAADTVTKAFGKLQTLMNSALPWTTSADSGTDFNAAIGTPGWFPGVLGGAAGSRNPNHPDGQTAATATNGVSDYYWLLNVYDTPTANAAQIAVPCSFTAPSGYERVKWRSKGGGTWSAWSALGGSAIADPVVSWASPGGYNGCFFAVGGALYGCCGTASAYSNIGMARGGNGVTGAFGVPGIMQVFIPSSSKVAKAGGNGYAINWALLENGDLYVWGSNNYGQLGLGHTNPVLTPTLSARGVKEVYEHPSCCSYDLAAGRMMILNSDSRLVVSGYNGNGQLGLGNTSNVSTWTLVPTFAAGAIRRVWNLGTAYGVSVVQTTDNKIWMCGYNGRGQLGIGTTTNVVTFQDVTAAWGGGFIQKIIGGFGYLDSQGSSESWLLLMFTDRLVCAGSRNYGGVPDGSGSGSATTPYTIPSLVPYDVTCTGGGVPTVHCLTLDNKVYGWGYNTYGAVGDGTTVNRMVPTLIPSLSGSASNVVCDKLLSGIQDNHAYSYYGCAYFRVLNSDGTRSLMACGYNNNGNTGTGTTAAVLVPTRVQIPARDTKGNPIVVDRMAFYDTTQGGRVSIAITERGQFFAWGYNGHYGVHYYPSGTTYVSVPVDFGFPISPI